MKKFSTHLTSLPVNLQGDNKGMASPSYSKDTPLKCVLAKPTSSSWFTPAEEETHQVNTNSFQENSEDVSVLLVRVR